MEKLNEIVAEINFIYKRLEEIDINNSNSSNVILELYYKYLKLLVQIQSPLADVKYDYRLHNGNCHFYALCLPMPYVFKKKYEQVGNLKFQIDVGEISGDSTRIRTESELLEKLYSDFEFLKIRYYDSAINKDPQYGGYKIAIFIDPFYDYHFVRQNIDGMWSQKIGYKGDIYCFNENPLDFINANNNLCYEYIKTIEIVKPTLNRVR